MPYIVRIERENAEAWALMPQLIERTGRFCQTYDPETAPHEIMDLIQAWFVLGDKRLGLWATVEDGRVVGHLLATPEPMNTEAWRYVLVRQAEVDPKKSMHQLAKVVFEDVLRWAASFGLDRLVMITHRNVDAMARMWGFKEYKRICVRSVKED